MKKTFHNKSKTKAEYSRKKIIIAGETEMYDQLKILNEHYDLTLLSAEKASVGAGSDTYFINCTNGKYVVKFPSVSEMNNPSAEPELCNYLLEKGISVSEISLDEKPKVKCVTKAGEFKRLDEESSGMKAKAKKKYILKGIRPLFKNDAAAEVYVDRKMYNKWRAIHERRKRFMRKAYLNKFNYFATFTYDDAKHTEDSFRKKLKNCLSLLANRSGWKYMGVWERGNETARLHFHALVKVPDGEMKGVLEEKVDFNLKTHRRKKTLQHSYFNEKFGRTDFEPIIENDVAYISAIEYILKYVAKTGEKIVYSRGLPMYLISDIKSDDVLCRIGVEERKLVLYDKFGCWDEGEYLGAMSEETKKRMRGTTS